MGFIEIQDSSGSALQVNTQDQTDLLQKLPQLTNNQIFVIGQLIEKLPDLFNEFCKSAIKTEISLKNIVGSITNVQTVTIGDVINIYFSETPPIPKSLTVYMPRTSLSEIVGRDAELDDLHQMLFDNRQVVLVNGMGGIGKTILAQVYVNHFWDEYCHIAWISQLSENLINDFVNAAGLIDNLNIQSAGKDAKEFFLTILNELNRITNKPNLLIIDNADASLADWANYLPHQPHWHILVTSREKIDKFDLKELDFLSEDEAVELFLRHYTHIDIPKSDIKDLVHTVDRHTLTIEILAKTAQRQRTKIALLKQAIQKDLKANTYIPHSGKKIERVTSYISSIFNLSKLSDDEVGLLKQFVCLPAVFHEYHLLKDLIQAANDDGEDTFSERLEALVEKGWLLRLQDQNSYKMHLIIAEVVKKQKPVVLSEVTNLVESVASRLKLDRSRDNPKDKFPWVPFGHAILCSIPESDDADLVVLKNELTSILKILAYSQGFLTLSQFALDISNAMFPYNHPFYKKVSDIFSSMKKQLDNYGDYMEPVSVFLATSLGYILKGAAQSKATQTAKDELLDGFWQWIRPLFIKDVPSIEDKPESLETKTKARNKLLELIQDESFCNELVKRIDNLQKSGIKEHHQA